MPFDFFNRLTRQTAQSTGTLCAFAQTVAVATQSNAADLMGQVNNNVPSEAQWEAQYGTLQPCAGDSGGQYYPDLALRVVLANHNYPCGSVQDVNSIPQSILQEALGYVRNGFPSTYTVTCGGTTTPPPNTPPSTPPGTQPPATTPPHGSACPIPPFMGWPFPLLCYVTTALKGNKQQSVRRQQRQRYGPG